MATLDSIIDRVSEQAGADFAFVLSRRGRLVTRNAPADMSEAGRLEIVAIAEKALTEQRAVVHHEMARQTLVPFGGAAPVDVFVSAREEAILCVVMATFAPQNNVGSALAQAVVELDALLEAEATRRERRRPSKKEQKKSGRGRRSVAPPGLDFDDAPSARGTVPFMQPFKPGRRLTPPPLPPEITVTEAKVGRATMAAIEIDAEGPEITYGMAPIGRATIAEIELAAIPRGDPRASAPEIRVELESLPTIDPRDLEVTDRQTLPFTEQATESKRRFEALQRARTIESSITLEETSKRTVMVGRSAPRPPASAPGKGGKGGKLDALLRSPRDSNIEAWHQALDEIVEPGEKPAPRRSVPPAAKSRPQTGAPGKRRSLPPAGQGRDKKAPDGESKPPEKSRPPRPKG